jgi:hypothetical protein
MLFIFCFTIIDCYTVLYNTFVVKLKVDICILNCLSLNHSQMFFQAFFIVFVMDIIQCRSILIRDYPVSTEQTIEFSSAIVHLILISVYLLSLLPSADDSRSQYEELLTNESPNERQSLTGSTSRRLNRHSYGGFHEPVDPDYLVRFSINH